MVENTTRSSRSTRLAARDWQESSPTLYPLETTVVSGGFLVTVTAAQASSPPRPGSTKDHGEEEPSSGISSPKQDILSGPPSVYAVSPDLLFSSAHSMPVSAAKK